MQYVAFPGQGDIVTAAWEDYLKARAGPPSQSEQTRCDNAERVVKDALTCNLDLQSRSVRVFLQGSYHNNTNIRQDSDVDVGILCSDTYMWDAVEPWSLTDIGGTAATYDYPTYKNDVGKALFASLGQNGVHRGNKAFDIHENTYRVDADVAAFFEYRFYYSNGTYAQGVALDPDDGGPRVINYPQQHHDNGVAKNNRTGRKYKEAVRILKRLRSDVDMSNKDMVTGFFLESALYNVSDNTFSGSYYDMMRKVVAEAYGLIANDSENDLLETNQLKFLFHPHQKWTKAGALAFMLEALNVMGGA